jgi:hypothetical protein
MESESDVSAKRQTNARLRWVAVAVVILIAGGVPFAIRDWKTKRDIARWESFKAAWEAKGEDFTGASSLSPAIPDESNFAAHPWIAALLGSGSSHPSQIAAHLKGSAEFAEWNKNSDRVQDPETAAAILALAGTVQEDLSLLREASERSDCRFELISSIGDVNPEGFRRLADVTHLIAAHASAALATGDQDAAIADIGELARIGRRVEKHRLLYHEIVGTLMEEQALWIVKEGLERDQWTPESKQALLKVLPPHVSLPDDIVETLKGERRIFLAGIDAGVTRESSSTGFEGWWRKFQFSPQRLAALNKRVLCEKLQPLLSGTATISDWDDLEKGKAKVDGENDAGLANGTLGGMARVVVGLMQAEEKADAVRGTLAK